MTYVNYYVAKQLTSIAWRNITLFENAMPIRLKSLNFVNGSVILDMLYAIMRPFMKAKFRQRVSLLGKNYAYLHKIIDPSILPSDYGGTGEDLDRRATTWWKSIVYEEDGISL